MFQLNELLNAGTAVGVQTINADGIGKAGAEQASTQAAINALQEQLDAIIAVMPQASCP